MYVCMYVCMYVRMYVCMYVRTYVCMYVCTYVRTYASKVRYGEYYESSTNIRTYISNGNLYSMYVHTYMHTHECTSLLV